MNLKNTLSKLMSSIAIFSMVFSLTGFTPTVNTAYAAKAEEIIICHATNSNSNPYNVQTPSKNADVGGHDGHNGPVWFDGITVQWGDIIPPFTYDGGSYPGKNWTASAEDIYNNGACNGDGVVQLPQCSDGVDNADTEDSVSDQNDPGCHTDGNPYNTSSYNPNDNDESNTPLTECSDFVDNADGEDTLVDAQDPGCWTDPNNSNTYSSSDNSEVDPNDVCTNILGYQLTMPEGYMEASAGTCVLIVPGCMDSTADNYNSLANTDNDSCTYTWCQYNSEILASDPLCVPPVELCTDQTANNVGQPLPCTYTWCQYNSEILASDPLCVAPDLCDDELANNFGQEGECTYTWCQYNSEILASDPLCVASCEAQTWTNEYVSDTDTEVGEGTAEELTFIHDAWDAVISGASWVWSTDPVVLVAEVDETETFTETFNVSGTPTSASLEIAADNTYSVELNGEFLCEDTGENNFGATDTCVIDVADLLDGENTLTFTVVNKHLENETPEMNPAGLLYKLTVSGNKCLPPPPVEVCEDKDADNYNEEGECTYTMCVYDDSILASDENCQAPQEETYVCSDGLDNDGDNIADYPNDEGCESPTDNSEDNRRILGGGGIVNNGGGQVLGATTDICSWDSSYMRRNWKGNVPEDVKKVQADLLNALEGNDLAVDGVYGPKTEAAVNAFQKKYENDILKPWGINGPTGIFYLSSLHKAQELLCPTNEAPLPSLINWSANPAVASR